MSQKYLKKKNFYKLVDSSNDDSHKAISMKTSLKIDLWKIKKK